MRRYTIGIVLEVIAILVMMFSLFVPLQNPESLITGSGWEYRLGEGAMNMLYGLVIAGIFSVVGAYYMVTGRKKERVVICQKCDAENKEDAKFCHKCGEKLRKS